MRVCEREREKESVCGGGGCAHLGSVTVCGMLREKDGERFVGGGLMYMHVMNEGEETEKVECR